MRLFLGIVLAVASFGQTPTVDGSRVRGAGSTGTVQMKGAKGGLVAAPLACSGGNCSIGTTPPAGAPTGTASATVWYSPNDRLNVMAHGAVGDNSHDDTAAIQAALDAAACRVPIYLPGDHKVTSTLHITCSGQHIYGDWSSGGRGGIIRFYGTGAMFQIGADDGNGWDANEYNGYSGTVFKGLYLGYSGSSRTPLANGQSTNGGYGTGTYAIQDWRGGSVLLDNVTVADFETGFFGVQSDINRFHNCWFMRNHRAFYLGPRSDQNVFDGLYSITNDTVVRGEGAINARFVHGQYVGDGSATTYPFEATEFVGASVRRPSRGWVWEPSNWFEHFYGCPTLDAFIALGVGSTSLNWDFRILHPEVANNRATLSVTPSANHLVRIENADYVLVDEPTYTNADPTNLLGLVSFTGSTSPHATVRLYHSLNNDAAFKFNGNGTPYTITEDYRGGARNIMTSSNVHSYFNDIWVQAISGANSQMTINSLSGYTSAVVWRTNGALAWQDQITSDQSRQWYDYINNFPRIYLGAVDGDVRFRMAGAGVLKIKSPDNTDVATVDQTGKGTFNGGINLPGLGATGKALCGKSDKTIGYCSTAPDATGACTCN